jgi:flagellin
MGVVINTNIASISASRSLYSTRTDLEQAMERLASGKRINGAKDDAAGMSVVTRMKAQITSLNQAVRNANDGISMLSTYDGAADEIEDIFIRMRELAVLAQNGSYSLADTRNANLEFQALRNEVDRIQSKTKFNGSLDISSNAANLNYSFQVGFNGGDAVTGTLNNLSMSGLTKVAASALFRGVTAYDVYSGDATALASAYNNNGIDASTLTGAAAFSGGAESVNNAANFSQWANHASNAVSYLDAGLSNLNVARATVGAQINRLEHTVSNLMNVVQRTEEARSRIEDADFASESASLARANVLVQAGSAMLAQANQNPQYVLALLRG